MCIRDSPKCGETTKHIKDYRIRTVKFGKVQRGPLIGKYRQRRYICPHCGHSFAESNPFVRKHMQLSVTNIRMLFDKLTESVTYTAIANECDTSITTVLRYCSMITIPTVSYTHLDVYKRQKHERWLVRCS